MRLLLDTHVFLWLNDDPRRLGVAEAPLRDPGTERLVSAVVAWELAIKYALGRLRLPQPPATYVPDRVAAIQASPVPVAIEHATGVADLPAIHGDPFDRLLVAQAIALGATLVTADATVDRYPVDTLLVA